MVDYFLSLDNKILKWINLDMPDAWIESILIWSRHPIIWVPIYVFILSFIIFNFKGKWYRIILFLSSSVALSDFISAKLFKPFFARLRPCHELLDFELIERAGCGGLYSFTSNHAANHFAISVFLALFFNSTFPRLKYLLISWASLVSFSQVYVGKHYPLDVLFGALLGTIIATVFYFIYKKVSN
jgi:undecaprenyl-diphosphatase